jgi:hypothetical protein
MTLCDYFLLPHTIRTLVATGAKGTALTSTELICALLGARTAEDVSAASPCFVFAFLAAKITRDAVIFPAGSHWWPKGLLSI